MRRTLAVFALLFASVLAGCSDSISGVNDSIAGSYALQTVNGRQMPFVFEEYTGYKDEWVSETITIRDNGTFQQDGSFRVTQNGVVTNEPYTDAGTYSRTGTNVTFRFNSDGSSATATVDNGALIVAMDGVSLIYRR